MIVKGLVKIVAAIAIAGFALIELGSPLWTKAQLDSTAHFKKTRGWYEVHLRATAQPASR